MFVAADGVSAGVYGSVTGGGSGGWLRFSTIQKTPMTIAAVKAALHIFHPRPGGLSGIDEIADAFREVEIHLGEAALAVSGKDEADFVKADVDVGMVLHFTGELGDAVHEIDGLIKVVELDRSLDGLALEFPFRKVFERGFDLFGIE